METGPPRWMNEPPFVSEWGGVLRVRTAGKTDFWRETFYGFVRASGHFRGMRVEGDFSAEVVVRGRYEELYDQAGLMVWVDERTWMKAGIEYTDGAQHFSVVVTREFSDWSVTRLEGNPASVRVRVTRHGEALRAQYQVEGEGEWRMARLAYLPVGSAVGAAVEVGVMCCSPQREDGGFEAEFEGFAVGAAISRALHE